MTESIIDFILEQDEDTILVEIKRVKDERNRLRAEQQLLEQLLAFRRSKSGSPGATSVGVLFLPADEDDDDLAGRVPLSTKDAIIRVMRTDPGRSWGAPQIVAALKESGIEREANTVRTTLHRLHADGVLARPGHGRYKLLVSALVPDGELVTKS